MDLLSNYVFNYVYANVFCTISVSILLYKQITTFNETIVEKSLIRILIIQLVYFLSCAILMLVTAGILPQTILTVYLSVIFNFTLFCLCAFNVFVYLELYQNAPEINNQFRRNLLAIPCLLNLALIFISPFTGAYFSVDSNAVLIMTPLSKLMIVINCLYPSAALISFQYNRRKQSAVEKIATMKITVGFPLFFIICGPYLLLGKF